MKIYFFFWYRILFRDVELGSLCAAEKTRDQKKFTRLRKNPESCHFSNSFPQSPTWSAERIWVQFYTTMVTKMFSRTWVPRVNVFRPLDSGDSLYAMVGRNPRSFDEFEPVLAHDEWRGSTTEISSRPGVGDPVTRNQFLRGEHFLVPDLPLQVDLRFLWSTLSTHRELKLVQIHQMTSGFVLPSRIVMVLSPVTRNWAGIEQG